MFLNNKNMETIELYEYIGESVLNKFKFIQKFGYNHSIDYTKRYPAYNPDFRVIFKNLALDRKLEVSYTHIGGQSGNDIIDVFGISIWKINGNGYFDIENYMLFIQKQEIKYLWLNSFEGTFEEKLDQLLDYVVDILQTYLMPVLKGEEWVDVPMNWYGAK
jgi:hypothetical protein